MTRPPIARITGLGVGIPPGVRTNADWERELDTSDDWIVERTGIRERRWATPDQGVADLSKIAADAALAQAGLEPKDLDGIVLARSAFHSSMNYRSVMVFGEARVVHDKALKLAGLDALVEQFAPGRLADLRDPTRKELNATTLLSLPIETFTAKVRSGPPDDIASDLDLPVWAGVVPLDVKAGTPVTAPDMRYQITAPGYLSRID